MGTQKLQVAVLMGGQSTEHEVSLQSAKNVIAGLRNNDNAKRYDVFPIGIQKNGQWFFYDTDSPFLNPDDPKNISLKPSPHVVTLSPGKAQHAMICATHPLKIDVVFPVLHGSQGEDGALQGLLRILGLPFVGADVLGSAIGMDKEVMKRLLIEAGLPTARFMVFDSEAEALPAYSKVSQTLGDIVFVKPANTGSSVGVHKVKSANDWLRALADAFRYDHKIIVEEFIRGREIECSVLGNEEMQASLPGEILCHHEFYSYEAKYLDPNGADVALPADLPKSVVQNIQSIAKKTMRALCCEGLARVDIFLGEQEKIYINEINTLPGFTNISMYPKMWEISGLSQSRLLHELIELALARHAKHSATEKSHV